MKKIILLVVVGGLFNTLKAQDLNLYQKKFYISGSDTLPYRLLLPDNYDPASKYPLLIFLHGSGERGSDNELQLMHGARIFLKEEVRKKFPAIIVFPQCPKNSFWSNMEEKNENGKRVFFFPKSGEPTVAMKMTLELLNKLIKDYPINEKKVYTGGLSMGGMGTFELVRRMPKTFAAAFPICGGANPSTAKKLKKTSWWVFHGAKDDVVPPSWSEIMVNALKQVNATVKFTLYPNANHNSWDKAFAEPELMSWLFSQRKK